MTIATRTPIVALFAPGDGGATPVSAVLSRFGRQKKEMSTTLPLYWNLSSADKEERVDASVKLVSSVLEFQAQFAGLVSPGENASPNGSEDDEEDAKMNDLDELNAEDVRYAIRRLVRGLASPRESSRLGFAVALTEVSMLDVYENYYKAETHSL